MKLKVRAHTCYLGNTGYASHVRGFFRELSKHVDLRVRNFNWDTASNLEKYINDIDLEIIDQMTLFDGIDESTRSDYKIKDVVEFNRFNWRNDPDGFEQDVDIVLIEQSHYYFYDEYNSKYKIAYTVWESTEVSDGFLNILQKFDAVWVVSKWHKECLIKQGIEESKIWIVPEGVNSDFNSDNQIHSLDDYLDGRFKFLFFGRWDYRKSVPEILKAFLEEFKEEEPVDLILSADNPFSIDGLSSTEERLKFYGLESDRIKVKHFPSYEDYISYLHNGHVMITCARSEGWNIPLCEAIAAGIPVTYSNWGAQLEFCEGIGNPINIVSEVQAINEVSINSTFQNGYSIPGKYCLPDYEHLKKVLRYIYQNYELEKYKAIEYSKLIRDKFNWSRVGQIGYDSIKEIVKNKKIGICLTSEDVGKFKFDTILATDQTDFNYNSKYVIYSKNIDDRLDLSISMAKILGYSSVCFDFYNDQIEFKLSKTIDEIKKLYKDKMEEMSKPRIHFSFIDGPRVTVNCYKPSKYLVRFINVSDNSVVYESQILNNYWCGTNRKYFTDWLIEVYDESNILIAKHRYNDSDKGVLISIESSSLGDSIAWMPGIEEYRKKHNCKIYVSTFHNSLFESEYPDIKFVRPGIIVNDIYASYHIGWYYSDGVIDYNKHPVDPKSRPMMATSFDILGLEFKQIKTRVNIPDSKSDIMEPYVCIAPHATAQAKYWNNPTGWQELIDWFNSIGYKVVLISKEKGDYMGNVSPNNIIDKTGDLPLEDRIVDLKYAKMFIGVGSGLSWLAWAVGTPVTLISGFSNPETEFFGGNVIRIFNPKTCNSCFNRIMLNAGDWFWCPDHKGTERQFECTKSITSDMVISEIKKFIPEIDLIASE